MTVTLPSPRASPDRETARRARKRIQKLAEAGSVTVAGWWRGDAGAIFAPRLRCRRGVGRASSKRLGDGGRKKGEDNHPKILPPAGPCFYPARSLRKIATDGTPRIFPGSGNFSQSPANQFSGVSPGGFAGC